MEMQNFDPNGVGLTNGHFMGLPFTEETAKLIVVSVPWDATVSYKQGTANGPQNVIKASPQLDVMQPGITNAWKLGIYVRPSLARLLQKNNELRIQSSDYIKFLEAGEKVCDSAKMQNVLAVINTESKIVHDYVYEQSIALLKQNKIPAILGGEHSVALGVLKALKEEYGSFGVLQIDAHMDLRKAYEGFIYSHASIFYNTITNGYIDKLVQVGIRDYCEEEVAFARANNVTVFYDDELKANAFEGITWKEQCLKIIEELPQLVYISFDIDGLQPSLCPETGTPVPGGLQFEEAVYLIKQIVISGRKIIGFDLCEVGGSQEWDGNVAARILYNLCNWTGKSQGLV